MAAILTSPLSLGSMTHSEGGLVRAALTLSFSLDSTKKRSVNFISVLAIMA